MSSFFILSNKTSSKFYSIGDILHKDEKLSYFIETSLDQSMNIDYLDEKNLNDENRGKTLFKC
jgi:hypothetical protein